MIRPLTVVHTLAGAFFLVCAALQLNDPDPIRWIALYAAAAAACFVAGRGRWAVVFAWAIAFVAFVWAATLIPVLREMRFPDLFKTMKATTPVVEEGRELLGLLLVCGFMVFVALRADNGDRST